MCPFIDTQRVDLVEAETRLAYQAMYSENDPVFIRNVFQWAVDWFEGRFEGYLPIDVRYHDLEHTMQGVLCMARLLRRRAELKHSPVVGRRLFELGVLAMLMHDSGYLKKVGDVEGTGAKYTLVHVDRSVAFAEGFMRRQGYVRGDIVAAQNMIRCTGLAVKLDAIPFQSSEERVVGCALGTADLVGQMAAPDYVEKLPVLFAEFEETTRFSGKAGLPGGFSSAEDMMRKTPEFWDRFVLPKLDTQLGGLVRVFSDPFPDGANEYIDRVNVNIGRLRKMFSKEEAD
jgi:hypothetical protein